jgi:2-polyprenyl-3-methyl-5-hydroxy-6-metoxy-1,4-benzoquinol methylase
MLYFTRIAAAYVRGRLLHDPPSGMEEHMRELLEAPLDALLPNEWETVIHYGLGHGLRLHRFKRTMGLPRVARVLGVLHGVEPSSLLDIGSGRGAFLWPLLDAFPTLPVASVDVLPHRVAQIDAVRAGGVTTLQALEVDVTALPFPARSFDVVTMLEVLEHIPDTAAALRHACRVARRFVILSVPSHADNNPEHIHLFGARELSALLTAHGAQRVAVEQAPGHFIVVARMAGA